LDLYSDPVLEDIEERIDSVAEQISEAKKTKADNDKLIKSLCLRS
jgi:F0F1-type ATP synthase membrane subunit b/b'